MGGHLKIPFRCKLARCCLRKKRFLNRVNKWLRETSPLCRLYQTSLVTDVNMDRVVALHVEQPHPSVIDGLSLLAAHTCVEMCKVVCFEGCYCMNNENSIRFCTNVMKNVRCEFSLLILDVYNLKTFTDKVNNNYIETLKTYKLTLNVVYGRDCEDVLERFYSKLCSIYEITFLKISPRGLCCGTYEGVVENEHISLLLNTHTIILRYEVFLKEMIGLEDDRQCWSRLNNLIVTHNTCEMDTTKLYDAVAAMIIEEAPRLKNVFVSPSCKKRHINHCDISYGDLFTNVIRNGDVFIGNIEDVIEVYLVVVHDDHINGKEIGFDIFTTMRGPLPGVTVNIIYSLTLNSNEMSPYSICNIVDNLLPIGGDERKDLLINTRNIKFTESVIKYCVSKCTAFVLSCENSHDYEHLDWYSIYSKVCQNNDMRHFSVPFLCKKGK